ncbi:MAG: sigma-70 family RNA polymerase sigma factor, partial [Pseudomonadota bacterium]
MNDSPSNHLVEHFFRHEYANLVSVLTKRFGFGRIDLIEDTVSSAMVQAMDAWKQGGVPEKPAAWIHRVAKNRLLDALRREKTHHQAMAFVGLTDTAQDPGLADFEAAVPDSLLAMMFVCCHPTLDRQSQIALTLKILCGFSLHEIARGLLIMPEAAKKRIQRAKAKLQATAIAVELPPTAELNERLGVVHDVLYLMFNEGYSTSHGIEPIRDDVCEEAARLCHLLCEHDTLGTPES